MAFNWEKIKDGFGDLAETVIDYKLARESMDLQRQRNKQQTQIAPNLTDDNPDAKTRDPFRPPEPNPNSGLIAVGVALAAAAALLILARS